MLPLMKDGEWAVCQQRSTGSEGCWCKHSAACLKELKEKSHQGLVVLLAIGWVWSGYLSWKIILRNSVEGRKGRTSKKKKIQNLHFLHSPNLVATPTLCRSCTDTWVLPRSRITSSFLWIPTVLNKIMMKKHLHPLAFASLKEMKWTQHVWRSTQGVSLKSCYRQRQKILSLFHLNLAFCFRLW